MKRSDRLVQVRLAALATATLIAGASLALRAQFQPVGHLLSVNVSPSSTSRPVGQQALFSATGVFEGGTRQLGGGGSPPRWSFIFSPSFVASACSPTQPASITYGGQVIGIQEDGTFHEIWSPITPFVAAEGTMTPLDVHADLRCADPATSAQTGEIDVHWSGTQYDGTYQFLNAGVAALVGLQWTSSEPAVAIVNQRGVATAISPGSTTITATYGSTCWPGETQPAGGCRGTVVGTAILEVTEAQCPPPSITALTATPDTIWPPNHKMADLSVAPVVSYSCQQPPTCRIVSLTSSEPANGLGDGDTSPDWEITGALTARVRAERSGIGDGRTYTAVVECLTSAGSARRAVVVTVPHNR